MQAAARALSVVAAAGWLVSLALPALSFRFDGEHDQLLYGYQVLASGWSHLLVLELSWLANFTFWFLIWRLWRARGSRRASTAAAVLTLLFALQSIEIFIFDRFFQFPHAYAGYYLWLASNLVLAGAVLPYAMSVKAETPMA